MSLCNARPVHCSFKVYCSCPYCMFWQQGALLLRLINQAAVCLLSVGHLCVFKCRSKACTVWWTCGCECVRMYAWLMHNVFYFQKGCRFRPGIHWVCPSSDCWQASAMLFVLHLLLNPLWTAVVLLAVYCIRGKRTANKQIDVVCMRKAFLCC